MEPAVLDLPTKYIYHYLRSSYCQNIDQPFMQNLFQETWNYISIFIISTHLFDTGLNNFMWYILMLYNRYHGYRWPDDTRSQGISSHSRDDYIIQDYSGFSTRRADMSINISRLSKASKSNEIILITIYHIVQYARYDISSHEIGETSCTAK